MRVNETKRNLEAVLLGERIIHAEMVVMESLLERGVFEAVHDV